MSNPWLIILGGLALGLLPPRLFYGSSCRHFTLLDAFTSARIRVTGDEGSGRRRRAWWKLPLLWIDPLRGFACARLIATGTSGMTQETSEQILGVLLVTCIATLVVYVMQMEGGRQRRGHLLAPIAFFVGYVPGLCFGLEILGITVVIAGLATMVAARNVQAGFLVAAGAALVAGMAYLGPTNITSGIYAITAAAPVPYAFLRKAKLVVPLRG